jgi:GNAT superfamily N-acetyltransferase
VIRPFRSADATAVVELVRNVAVDWWTSPAALVYRSGSHPERARQRAWVAVEGDDVVGFCQARLLWEVADAHAGTFRIEVRPDRRRRGIGTALYEHAERHLYDAGGRSLRSFAEEESGHALLEARGFEPTDVEQVSVLVPAAADLSSLRRLEESKEAEGFRAVPLAEVLDRPRALHEVYAETTLDVPGDLVVDDLRFEEWERECLGDPDLSREGSTVVLYGARPVALSFLMTDGAGRAATDMTGTLPEFRRRGLARLAKLGTIQWAAANGVEQMVTGNPSANTGMLALNRSLGYVALAERTFFRRDG